MIFDPLIIGVVVVCCGIVIAIAYAISKYCCNMRGQPPPPPSQPSTSPSRPSHVHCSGYSRFYDSSETVRGSYSTRINLNPARVSGSRANASYGATTSNPSRLSVSDFVVNITPAARSTVDHNPARASRSSRVDHNSGRASLSARVDSNSAGASGSTRVDRNSSGVSSSTRVDRNSVGVSSSTRDDQHNSVGISGSTIAYPTFGSITPTHYRFSASDFRAHNPPARPTVNQFLGAIGTLGYSGTSGYSGATTSSISHQISANSGPTRLPTRNSPTARPNLSTSTGTRSTNSVVNTQADRRHRETRRPNPPSIRTTRSNINNNHNNNNNRVQQQNSESTEQLQFRRTVLHLFKCPFEEEEACMYKNNPRRCFFTHVGPNGTEGTTDLKEVPAYACIYHLVKPDTCRKRTNNSSTQNPNSIQNILPCINGIHLSLEQMIDLDHYERTNRLTIRRFFGQDAERQCAVCLETVLSKRLSRNRRFAILENCAHCFCAQCIIGWRNQSVQLTCPLCRTVSDRVAYRRRFTDKPAQKKNMFR